MKKISFFDAASRQHLQVVLHQQVEYVLTADGLSVYLHGAGVRRLEPVDFRGVPLGLEVVGVLPIDFEIPGGLNVLRRAYVQIVWP